MDKKYQMGKLKYMDVLFQTMTHMVKQRLSESKNIDYENYTTPGMGFTFLRENIIRTAVLKDDDIVIIQYHSIEGCGYHILLMTLLILI